MDLIMEMHDSRLLAKAKSAVKSAVKSKRL